MNALRDSPLADPAPTAPRMRRQRHLVAVVTRAPLRRWRLVVACTAAILGATALSVAALPRWYAVHTRLVVERPPTAALANPAVLRERDPPMAAAREVLLGRANVLALVRQTDFVRHHLESRPPAIRARDRVLAALGRDPRTEDAVVDAVRARQWVIIDDVGAVTIGFAWPDPELARRWLDASLRSLLEARRASEIVAVGELVEVLESHVAASGRAAAAAAAAVQQKERQLGITGRRSTSLPLETDELTELQSELVVRQRSLAAMEAARDRESALLMGQLTRQLNVYAAEHPIVRATRERIQSLSRPSAQIETLRTETRSLAREVALEGGEIVGESLLAELQREAGADDARVALERTVLRTVLALYASQADRLEVARLELDAARAGFADRYRVVDPPRTPRRPTTPTAGAALLGALAGGLAFAVFASAVLELRRAGGREGRRA